MPAPNIPNIDLSNVSSHTDLTPTSITDAVHAANKNCENPRLKFIFENLVNHLHNFVRETSITTEEWMATIDFLTKTGQKCTDLRQEFILLSDVLGVSSLVDMMSNAKPPGVTEATVLGPFFTADAQHFENGDSIASEGKGDYMFVEGRVLDTNGNPIKGAVIDTWETDGEGKYDNQYDVRDHPDCRGRLKTADDGSYSFRAIVPVSYPIPDDGPVGLLVEKLNRHNYRPAHLHMMIEAPGFEKLITALYFDGDPFVGCDVVFGVRGTLVVKPELVEDVNLTKQRGFKDARPHQYLKYDFILATEEEAKVIRKKNMPNAPL